MTVKAVDRFHGRLTALRALGYWAVVGTLGLAGYWLMFSTFMAYDDEGYVLVSLKNYAEGGQLYSQVYSQYGPLFFLFHGGLNSLWHHDFNQLFGRWFTWSCWLGATLCSGLIVRRLGASWRWASLAAMGAFAQLSIMTSEPAHPGGLIAFVVAVGALVAIDGVLRGRMLWVGSILGGIGVALACIKVNVGAYFLWGSAGWLLSMVGLDERFRGRRPFLLMVGWSLVPALVMRPLMDYSWVQIMAVVLCLAALSITSAGRHAGGLGWRSVRGVGIAAAVTGVLVFSVVTGMMLWRGNSGRELLEGMVLAPARHPRVYSFPLPWIPGTLVVACGGFLLSIWWGFRNSGRDAFRFLQFVGLLRVLLIVVMLGAWLGLGGISAGDVTFSFGLSLLWVCLLPIGEAAGAMTSGRMLLCLLLLGQSLHAYPVAGSQVGWGTFLWAPVLVLAVEDGVKVLRPARKWVADAECWLLPIVVGMMVVYLGRAAAVRFGASELFNLAGTGALRGPATFVAEARVLDRNCRWQANTLFSVPGAYGLNLWSEKPTPTQANATHWFSLLTEQQQQEIVARLQADSRAAVVVLPELVRFLKASRIPIRGPLRDYLIGNFRPIFHGATYEFWVKKEREATYIDAVTVLPTSKEKKGETEIEMVVGLPAGREPDSMEWWVSGENGEGVLAAAVDLRRCTVRKRSEGKAEITLHDGTVRVDVQRWRIKLPAKPGDLPRDDVLIRLRDSRGQQCAELTMGKFRPQFGL